MKAVNPECRAEGDVLNWQVEKIDVQENKGAEEERQKQASDEFASAMRQDKGLDELLLADGIVSRIVT